MPGRCGYRLGEVEDAGEMRILSGRGGRCRGDVDPVWERRRMEHGTAEGAGQGGDGRVGGRGRRRDHILLHTAE